jgi:flagellar biosynthesis/type III secretory pathway protein FliH
VRVRIGPAFAGVEQSVREHLASLGIEVDLAVSPNLSDYGCVVQTELGRVNESIEERLSILVDSIEEERQA